MPYFMNANNFERIEILRSSSALLTGPGGMTGVINLVPRTYEECETNLKTSYGSWNTTKVHLSHGDTRGRISYALGAGNRHTDGPNNFNAAESITDLYGHISAEATNNLTVSLDAFGVYGKRELRQAEPPAKQRVQRRLQYFDPIQAFLTVGKVEYQPTEWASSQLLVNYSLRDHDFINRQEDGSGNVVVSGEREERDYEYGVNFIQAVKPIPDNTVRFGALYNRWKAPNGKRYYTGNRCDKETYSWVVVDEHSFGRLRVNAGYRWSRTYVDDFGGYNLFGEETGKKPLRNVTVHSYWEDPTHNASVGAAYYITKTLSLNGNFAYGQVDARSGALTDQGTPADDETRYKFDVGIKKDQENLGTAALTTFCVLQKDAIVVTGDQEVGGDTVPRFSNRDQRQYGIELDLRSARFSWGGQGFFNVVGIKSKRDRPNSSGMERNDNIPRCIISGGVNLKRGRFDCALLAKYYSDYDSVRFLDKPDKPESLGDYVDLTANAGYSFGSEKQYRVFVEAENLLDDEYSTVPGYPDYGLGLSAGLSLRF